MREGNETRQKDIFAKKVAIKIGRKSRLASKSCVGEGEYPREGGRDRAYAYYYNIYSINLKGE